MIFTSIFSKLGVLTYPIYLLSKPDSPDNGYNNPISGAKVIKILHICKWRVSIGYILCIFIKFSMLSLIHISEPTRP